MIGIGWILLSVDIIERGTESDGGFTYEYAVEEKTFVCSNYLNWNNCCNRVITKISTWHGSAY